MTIILNGTYISKITFIAVFLLAIASCNESISEKETIVSESDTTKVMKLLLDSAFYRHNLPDISALTEHNPFGDTILICNEIYQGDSNIARYFPVALPNIKLKFLKRSQICSMAIQFQNDTTFFPNFLQIRGFQKIDTTYQVYLQNTCVIPFFDKNGHHLYKKGKLEGIDTLPCIFGFLCGGGIGMTFTKKGDTMQSKITGRWSD